MLVSTRGRYAIRIVLELSSREKGERVSLSELSKKQEISLKYAETIVALLVKAGLLDGQRGKRGGYRLTRDANEISVGEILIITEDSLSPVACLDCKPNQCERASSCKTLPMWEKLDDLIKSYLFSITIADLN
ncbi:MAG: Rrf2 family transcriptional regulator [Sphaerochaetaceae bacterium]|jgi:Rrf2 family iron-sulfur cluster assembly transcriptional regulator|nr:Rrf2 family transcriptional regulator [Sphaerochaetaceae bacterium]